MEIPLSSLSPEALLAVVDDFVLREGTDYGRHEASLESKRADVMNALKSGRARIHFDPETETVTLVPVAP
ncbi:MAG: YheU family protein [Calothrix sp. SM1_5_4]|nr:YheU family protein [Calothrix sp. SM1_5_4]